SWRPYNSSGSYPTWPAVSGRGDRYLVRLLQPTPLGFRKPSPTFLAATWRTTPRARHDTRPGAAVDRASSCTRCPRGTTPSRATGVRAPPRVTADRAATCRWGTEDLRTTWLGTCRCLAAAGRCGFLSASPACRTRRRRARDRGPERRKQPMGPR